MTTETESQPDLVPLSGARFVRTTEQSPASPFAHDLGLEGRDIITGFTGIITGRADYVAGCRQYCLQPACSNGKFEQAQWFDEERVRISADPRARLGLVSSPSGGPADHASAAPTR